MRALVFIILFIIPIASFSQKEEKTKKEKDKVYVEKIKALFSFRPFVQQNIDLFTFRPKDASAPTVLYRPATGLNIGGSVAFKFLSFSYQRNIPVFQPFVPADFEAKHQRIGFDLGGNMFGLGFDFQQNNGFYIWNSSDIQDSLISDPNSVIYREDIQSRTIGTNLRFTFSNKLSHNALFDQSQRQKRSKGALTLMVGNRFHGFKAVSPFVTPDQFSAYSGTEEVNRLWINTTNVMPGYGYIAVKNYWNVGLFAYVGSGLQIRKHFTAMDEGLGVRFPFMSKLKTGISYNGKFFYAKLFAMADYMTTGFRDAKIGWLQTSWEFSIGIRLYGKKDK